MTTVSYTHLDVYKRQALTHATPTQARRVRAYYIIGISQPEISRREGVDSSKVSIGYSVLLWILVMLFPGGFAAMFTSDAQLMEYTKTALRIYMGADVYKRQDLPMSRLKLP